MPKRRRAALHRAGRGVVTEASIAQRGMDADEVIGYHLESAYRAVVRGRPTCARARADSRPVRRGTSRPPAGARSTSATWGAPPDLLRRALAAPLAARTGTCRPRRASFGLRSSWIEPSATRPSRVLDEAERHVGPERRAGSRAAAPRAPGHAPVGRRIPASRSRCSPSCGGHAGARGSRRRRDARLRPPRRVPRFGARSRLGYEPERAARARGRARPRRRCSRHRRSWRQLALRDRSAWAAGRRRGEERMVQESSTILRAATRAASALGGARGPARDGRRIRRGPCARRREPRDLRGARPAADRRCGSDRRRGRRDPGRRLRCRGASCCTSRSTGSDALGESLRLRQRRVAAGARARPAGPGRGGGAVRRAGAGERAARACCVWRLVLDATHRGAARRRRPASSLLEPARAEATIRWRRAGMRRRHVPAGGGGSRACGAGTTRRRTVLRRAAAIAERLGYLVAARTAPASASLAQATSTDAR